MPYDLGDQDADIRVEAFRQLDDLRARHGGAIPWSAIAEGFSAKGRHFLYSSSAEGIFRPQEMQGLLSVKTVVPKPKGRIWYEDQISAAAITEHGSLAYSFTGSDPQNARNRWLKDAQDRQLPIIYFVGVSPAVYEPIYPVFVTHWDPVRLSCALALGPKLGGFAEQALAEPERKYALALVKRRLHQAVFRESVLAAYRGTCAFSTLRQPRLVDAAHIIPDGDEGFGQANIRNGICMSKLHHAAFDANLIGVDSDCIIHVSDRLRALRDGPPIVAVLKRSHGEMIRAPGDLRFAPDPDRLAMRFRRFKGSQ